MVKCLSKVILILLLFWLCGCLTPVDESYTHSIEYRITVGFTNLQMDPLEVDEVHDFILIVPIPIREGPIELRNLSVPDGWEAEIVETPYGEMLKLRTERVKTWVWSHLPVPVGSNETPETVKKAAFYDFELRLDFDREINTLNPLEDEYVLKPKLNLWEVSCPNDYLEHYRNVKCYRYATIVFYNSSPAISVNVNVWLNGRNTWFQAGWTGNEFDDYIFADLSRVGWSNITGNLTVGMGVYE